MSIMQDAGLELSDQDCGDAGARRAAAMRRALMQHRVSVLEGEQGRAASEYERGYARSAKSSLRWKFVSSSCGISGKSF